MVWQCFFFFANLRDDKKRYTLVVEGEEIRLVFVFMKWCLTTLGRDDGRRKIQKKGNEFPQLA